MPDDLPDTPDEDWIEGLAEDDEYGVCSWCGGPVCVGTGGGIYDKSDPDDEKWACPDCWPKYVAWLQEKNRPMHEAQERERAERTAKSAAKKTRARDGRVGQQVMQFDADERECA